MVGWIDPLGESALVGRERERTALRDSLAATLDGHGRLVLISGEAGIGKTALAATLCADAERQGALALVGRCYDLSETPPYGPWIELFGRYQPGGGLPVLPAAFARRGTVGAMASQATLFTQVEDFLHAVARQRPLVLIFDDLHWSDPASLDLLRAIARHASNLPLLLVCAYRGDELTRPHPLGTLLPMLVRETAAVRLTLPRLRPVHVATWVSHRYALRESDAARLATHLHTRSEGNPFFIGELARTLEEEEIVRVENDRWHVGDLTQLRVPALLRQLIDGRLARLGEDARAVLTVAAVIGQEVPLAAWQAVTAVDEGTLLDVIDRAAESRILEESADGASVRFVHALLREALYEGVPPSRRRVWHRRVGEALIALPDPDPDAAAHHLRQAGDPRAVAWLVRAGERAQQAHAYVTAAGRYEAALTLMDRYGGDPARRCARPGGRSPHDLHAVGRRARPGTVRPPGGTPRARREGSCRIPGWPVRPRSGGAATGRRRAHQPRDCRRPLSESGDGEKSRGQHPRQDRHRQSRRRRRFRPAPRAGLTLRPWPDQQCADRPSGLCSSRPGTPRD